MRKSRQKILTDKPYLDRVRDVLLFCCYTGLRYSDAYNLTKQDINNDVIEFVTKKTNDLLRVELNKHSRAILDKYKDVPFEDNKALPVISNQKMNDYVKTLGQEAGIDEPIRETYYQGNKRIDEVKPKHEHLSTHVGRRTFICTAYLWGYLCK
nr:site-specific integrase [Myroides odoratimimus]